MSERPLPAPHYCCASEECCAEVTWPAEDLWWSDKLGSWYCDDCWNCREDLEEDKGISLAEELKQRGLTR